jgi:hypothetical protein
MPKLENVIPKVKVNCVNFEKIGWATLWAIFSQT